jgi:hypothetical protein
MKDYVIVVYATHAHGMYQALIDDANAFNVPITVLGWGEPWVELKQKFVAISEFVKGLPADRIVLFLDAFDTKMARHPQGAVDIFKALNVDICFSSDKTFNKFVDFVTNSVYKSTCADSNMKYINTGMYLGYACKIEKLLTHLVHTHPNINDDQLMMSLECERVSTMFNIHVDQSNTIFQNINVTQLFKKRFIPFYNVPKSNSYFIGYPASGGSDVFEPMLLKSRLKRDVFIFSDSKSILKNNQNLITTGVVLFLFIWIVYLYCGIETVSNKIKAKKYINKNKG